MKDRISGREWRLVAVVAAILVVLTSLAPLYGAYRAAVTGTTFTGLQVLSPGDLAVYLSYIDQVKGGAVQLDNVFTTEPLMPVFNILWFGVGLLARALGVSALVAYHLAHIALIPVLAVAAYALVAEYVSRIRDRIVAFVLFMFGSGFGAALGGVFSGANSAAGTYERPIDLWVGESNTFLTAGYTPHFVASLALILGCVFFFQRGVRTGSQRYAVIAGVLGTVLFQFHPFHAPTLYGVFAAFLVWEIFSGEFRRGHVLSFAIFAGLGLPSIAYHYYLTHYDAAASALLTANLTLTPAIWHVVIGFGLPFLFAPIGFIIAGKPESLFAISLPAPSGAVFPAKCQRPSHHTASIPRWSLAFCGENIIRMALEWRLQTGSEWRERMRGRGFLAVWACTQLALTYSPLTFQRRLLEGLEFPLVMLAVPAIMASYEYIRHRGAIMQSAAGIVACFAFFFSSFHSVAGNVMLYRDNRPPIFFFSPAKAEALRWVRFSLPRDAVVFGSFETGNAIGGWADRRVYAGHWVNTVDGGRKIAEIAEFFGSMDAVQQTRFVREQGITHVVVGPSERALGSLRLSADFEKVFENGEYAVYEDPHHHSHF